MNRKIVLRSIIAVVLLGVVLVFSSCKKEEKQIIGKWKFDKVEIKELSCTEPIMETVAKMVLPAIVNGIVTEIGLEAVEFTKDGKAITKKETAKYKVNGNKLTITNSDYISGTSDISFDKKTMYWDMNVLDFVGEVDVTDIGITKCIMRITYTKDK
jgi:hypothetical protein